jgi:hypothetical protein
MNAQSNAVVAKRSLLKDFDPDQPRVPAGNPDGGQWTSGGGAAENQDNGNTNTVAAARPKPTELECDAQYERDLIICRMLRSSACYGQAMARYAACISGRPIPSLNF